MVTEFFPEVALGLHFVPGRLEQGTTQLLNLIPQEGQHHQQGQHHRQVLLAVSLAQLPQLGQNCTNFQVLFRRNSLFVGPTSTQTPL